MFRSLTVGTDLSVRNKLLSFIKFVYTCNHVNTCFVTLFTWLGLLKSEEQDTFLLRQMFVDRMLEPDEELREFIRNGDSDILRRNIEEFRCPGFFNNELGDFVMIAVSSILRIPIVIVSSNESAYCIPFVPPDPVMKAPLYVAFTSYGPGHYDSTDHMWSVAGTFRK